MSLAIRPAQERERLANTDNCDPLLLEHLQIALVPGTLHLGDVRFAQSMRRSKLRGAHGAR